MILPPTSTSAPDVPRLATVATVPIASLRPALCSEAPNGRLPHTPCTPPVNRFGSCEAQVAFAALKNRIDWPILDYAYDSSSHLATIARDGKPDVTYTDAPATNLVVKVSSDVMKETTDLTYDDRRRPVLVTSQRVHSVTGKLVTERWQFAYDCPE